MFFTTLAYAVLAVLNSLISLFPTANASVVALIGTQISNFRTFAFDAQPFLPVSLLLSLLAAVLLIESSLLTYKLARWIVSILSAGFIK